jgi:hypothetical protein
VAGACGSRSKSAPVFKKALETLPPETTPRLSAELLWRYGTAHWLQNGIRDQANLAVVLGAFRDGLAALAASPSATDDQMRSFLLRALREVLCKDTERVDEALRVLDDEISLLARYPHWFSPWIEALNAKAEFLRTIGEERRERSRLDQALEIYRTAIAAMDDATDEQKHTSEWLIHSRGLPTQLTRTEAARSRLKRPSTTAT